MKFSPIKTLSVMALMSATFSSFVYSGDIVRTLRVDPQASDEPDNFLQVGVAAGGYTGSSVTEKDGQEFNAGLYIEGSYNYKGFFVDVNAATSDPITIGYNAYNSDNWSFDVTLGATYDGISESTGKRFEGISERESSAMLGGRLTGYFGKNIVQFAVKHDVSDTSNATSASAFIGRNWQYRNWNFHGLIGLAYDDKKAMDYYFGVSEQEAAVTDFAEYEGKAQVSAFSSIGVTYPINESWIFQANAGIGTDFGRNESPLFIKKRDFSVGFGTSISYVF